MEELNLKRADLLFNMQTLRETISKDGATTLVQILSPVLESLKAFEEQESELQTRCNTRQSKLQAEINKLEEAIQSGNERNNLSDDFGHLLNYAIERQNLAREELAAKLRAILLLKRQLDDVPSQAELIQYERRFSELNGQIQRKLQKTRTCYDTFNALLEIKDLMLKETSLLNSISLQFQDAIASTAARMKLIDSMEGVLKRIQQKLQKVQVTLESEQKVCDVVKEKYVVAISEQRRCYSLLKAFQEECAKNDRLQTKLQE